MLDMAFQLLAFFVLTFRQSPLEGQISLRLPPPQATVVVKNGEAAGADANNKNPLQGMDTLTISVSADPPIRHDQRTPRGQGPGLGLAALDGKLKDLFRDPRKSLRPGHHPGERFVPLRRVDENHQRLHASDLARRQEALET